MVDGAPDWAVPVWLTPISSLLVHGGWLHIIFDMAFLFVCGRFAEHVFGPWLTLAIFLLGAYGAAIVQWAVGPGEMAPVMGTAGAISALIGVNALLYSNQKVKALGPLSANMVRIIWLAAAWIALNIMLEIAVGAPRGLFGFGNSGTGTSVGGFIAGLLLTRPMLHLRFGRVKAVS